MNHGRLADNRTHSLIHKLLIGVICLSLVCLGTLATRGLLLHSQYVLAGQETQSARQEIVTATEMVQKGAGLDAPGTEAGLSAVSAFQSVLVEKARANGCIVREVGTSSEAQPYNSRFKKDTPESAFIQLSFKAVVIGTPGGLVAVLESLSRSPVPFEYDMVSIRRNNVKGSETTVEATIDLRVLTKAGGA